MRRYRKSDIDFHGTNYDYDASPAIRVKVDTGMAAGWQQFEKYRADQGYNPAFTREWLDAYVAKRYELDLDDWWGIEKAMNRYLEDWWAMACEHQLESAQEDIDYFFGHTPLAYDLGVGDSPRPPAQCWLTGRSGGWLYLGDGKGRRIFDRGDVAHWDAIAVAAWGRFEKACIVYAAEVPYQTLDMIYYNVFEAQREREESIVQEMVA